MFLIILVGMLMLMSAGTGHLFRGGQYRRHGCGCGGILLLLFIILLIAHFR